VNSLIPQLSAKDKYILNQKLNSVYQDIHSLPNSDDIALYKSELRDLIINTSPEEIKSKLTKDFVRLDIYDYLDVSQDKASKVAEKLK